MKPQDIVVALKLCLCTATPTYAVLGKAVGLSASEAHAAVQRLIDSQLLDPDDKKIYKEKLRNFIVHGLPFTFPAKAQEVTRGLPTAWAAPAMKNAGFQSDALPPVWPDPEGKVQGTAVKPLYKSAVNAAKHDPALYGLLALVDAIRLGRARERNYAEKELTVRMNPHA